MNRQLNIASFKILFIGILSIFVHFETFAQPVISPEISCISTITNSDLQINWNPPSDPGGNFIAYHIYQGPNTNGPFIEVATLNNIADNSFIASPPTLNSDLCYYIQVEALVGGIPTLSPPSATYCSIFLNVSPSAAPQGYAFLDWNNPFPNGTLNGDYSILMEYPAGTWTEIATLPQDITSYSHEISVCNEFLNFQIVFQTPQCDYTSNIDGDLLTDLTPPAIPNITSVSIDHATNDAIIEWEASTSPDTQGYILYYCNADGTVSIIDTIYGFNNTQFVDILAPTAIGPVSYLIAAIDTCYSGTPPSPNTSPAGDVCNASVYISPIAYAICEDNVDIHWTSYEGWASGVDSYDIYHSFNGSPFEIIATVDANTNDYNHLVSLGGLNRYYIVAHSVSGGYTATSNLQNVQVTYPAPPSFTYITSASVIENGKIEIDVLTEPVGSDHFYYLERQQLGTGDWDLVDVQNNFGIANMTFTDEMDVKTDVFSYMYRVDVQNVCDDMVDTSEIAISTLLSGFAYNERLSNALQWSDYIGFDEGVSEYRIYRKDGDEVNFSLVSTVGGTINYYEDDVSALEFSPGDFTYKIEAVSNPSPIYPGIYSAFSNEIRLSLLPVIWVPNAFVVDGFNTTFGPVVRFADMDTYRMIIYSRWGDVIFDTTDITEQWDGFMNGRPVQEGVYVYYISVKDGQGRLEERRGTVTLLSARAQ
ncbi:MAG: gliding motility-associated C-terminal domain-containing protein [Flavobacteriales bacterium]